MKTILLLLLAVPVLAVDCPKNCVAVYDGCACEQPPAEVAVSVQPSDDKPHHSQIPEWQDGGVQPATPPSLAAQDAKQDREKTDADKAGKSAAGVP